MSPEQNVEAAVRISRSDFFAQLREAQTINKNTQFVAQVEATRQNILDAEKEGLMVKFFQLGNELYTEFTVKPPLGFRTRRDL
jgi:hypothetical protein